MMLKQKKALLAAFLLLIIYLFQATQKQDIEPASKSPLLKPVTNNSNPVSSSAEFFMVKRAVDGDTIELENGTKVRYIGVNTPESVDPRKTVECFGKEASKYNESLVVGKKVKLEKDVSDRDRYGRLLRFVYLEDGTFVNLKLLEEGYAGVMTVPPNVAKADLFKMAEKTAREGKFGLWNKCK